MTTGFLTKSFVFDPRPSFPLVSVVKRYWKEDSPYLNDPDALTLIFIHGAGFHKEQWDPCIDDLQALFDANSGASNVKIREMWTMDAPNHGDSAMLNEDALKLGYDQTFPLEEFGRNIHLFISGLGKGVDHDFCGHNLVAIGHSMGAACLALSLGYHPRIKFSSIILCEIACVPGKAVLAMKHAFVNAAEKRRDTWDSKEDAYSYLRTNGPWVLWDDRVLRIFVDSGIRSFSSSDDPGVAEGVTLKCTRAQEAASYSDSIGYQRVYYNFESLANQVETHLIFGEMDNHLLGSIKYGILQGLGGIDKLASLSRVPDAGHLVVQTHPSGLAKKIYDALAITLDGMRSFVRVKM